MGHETETIMKSNKKASDGPMRRLVRRCVCAWDGHAIYSYRADGGCPFRRSPVDDWIETECLRCGKTLRAPYGLALPNLKLGPPPKTLLMGAEWMDEAQCRPSSAPGGNTPPSEVEEILYRAIADEDVRTLNGYAMRHFVDKQDYLSATVCRARVKSWRDDEFRLPNAATNAPGANEPPLK
jgi:hypothetical protein